MFFRQLKSLVLYFLMPLIILGAILVYGWGGMIFGPKEVIALKSGAREINFGVLSGVRGEFKKTFVVQNITDKEVVIKRIYTDCGCLSVNLFINNIEYSYSLPRDTNEKPVNLVIPSGGEVIFVLNLEINESLERNFYTRFYLLPFDGKILKVAVSARIY